MSATECLATIFNYCREERYEKIKTVHLKIRLTHYPPLDILPFFIPNVIFIYLYYIIAKLYSALILQIKWHSFITLNINCNLLLPTHTHTHNGLVTGDNWGQLR